MTGRLEACIKLAKKVGIKNRAVLDVGCSYGWFLNIAFKEGSKSVYGVEPDNEKIELAKKSAPKAVVIKGTAGKIDFPKNKFDVVTLFDVIEHVPAKTEPQVLKEINKVLKPKGHLLVSTPSHNLFSTFSDPAWYFGHRHYSENDLTKLLNDAGFTIESLEIKGGIWEVIAMWVLYITKWIFRIPMPFEEWFDIKRRKEFNHPGNIELFVIAQKN